MICRMWHGWTTIENADAYAKIVRQEVIPDIESMDIPGFRHIDLLRYGSAKEVEFVTLMWFDNLDSVKNFMGENYTVSHVPASARAVLERFDHHATHYEVLDRRDQ